MRIMDNLRDIAYGRRLVKAQERIADSLELIAEIYKHEWAERHAPKKRRPAEFGQMDVEELNRLYHLRAEAAAEGRDEDE